MPVEQVERDRVVGFWEEEFGVSPATLDGYRFYKKGARKVWAVSRETVERLGGSETLDALEYESVGLPLMRVGGEHDKPTTDALQRFGDEATRKVVDVDADAARAFVRGETVEREYDVEDLGYVVVRHDGDVLGCGLYFPGELRSQVPKGRRVDLVV
jgi:NOL1/NOP2/fmu family ribosome biogenesis protein